MNEKILDSTHQGITTSSSHQSSMNGNNFFKLGWENGEIVVKRSSSNITQQNNPSCKKLEEDFAMIKQEKDSMHDEFLDSSTSFKKQVIDHSSQAPQENSKKLKYLRNCDQRKVKVINNFSNFLVPKVFPKSTTQPIRNEETFAKLEEIEVAKGSKGIKGYEKLSLDDENSEAEAILRAKGKAKSSLLCDEPLLSSSPIWSIEASNDPKITKYEDTDESTYSTRDNDEDSEDVLVKETPAQEGNSVKRKETNNLCEKNHRDIMNKKMRILKELIPNCNKVDKASLLDDAIDYVKSLKLQLQIMSVGNGLCMPQMMLPQLMGSGMGFSFRPWTPHQLPIPSLSITKDNNILQNMFGSFSNQMQQMPTLPHHVPNFMPMMIANNSSLTTPNVSDLHAKAELCDTNNHAPFNHIPSYYPF